MNHFCKNYKVISILFLFTLTFMWGCKKDDTTNNDSNSEYKAYVNHQLILIRTADAIKSSFQSLELFYPEVSELTAHIKYDVEVYNVTYKTIFQGNEIEVSGLVCIPVSDEESFPIVSFQNGTNTAHKNAPTKNLNGGMFNYLQSYASLGCIMLIPDYIGFGKSEQYIHPYLHKESTVLSVENLIIATREMIDNNLIDTKWNSNLYLLGYSQGGWSTMCTHKDITENPDLDLNVTASACGAGPYDLALVQNFMFEKTTYPQPVYMAYTMVSYLELGIVNNPVTDFFNEPYATPLPTYFRGQYNNDEINALLNDTVSVLISNDLLQGIDTDTKYEDLRNGLSNNSVHGWNTQQPIRIYHGTVDNYVPPTTSQQIYREFVDAGASNNVTYIPLEGLNHSTGAVPAILDALIWFNNLESGVKDNHKAYLKIDASKPQFIAE